MIDLEKLKEQVRSLSTGSLGSAAQVDSICYALDRLQMKLKEAEQAKQNICSLLDRALAQNEAMKAESEEARKSKPQPPAERFAIVMDRNHDGEGISLAVHDGINYTFSDGDCYDRDGDTLDGYTAEFLTQFQLEQRLEEMRKGAERYAWTIAFDDNAEFVLSMVLNHGPDHKSTIDMEIDREMERQSDRQQKGQS